jgi:hypothetical protein
MWGLDVSFHDVAPLTGHVQLMIESGLRLERDVAAVRSHSTPARTSVGAFADFDVVLFSIAIPTQEADVTHTAHLTGNRPA